MQPDKINTATVLETVKEHKVISLQALCKVFHITPDDEESRPRYWRLVQALACLVMHWRIGQEWKRGQRIYSM